MKKLILLFALAVIAVSASAQKVVIKNNLLYDAALTPNLGVEIGLGQRTTLDISGNWNPIKFNKEHQWRHWLVQPEFRYWFCSRFDGHFLGAHLMAGQFNLLDIKLPFGLFPSLENKRNKGTFYGIGISYGYQWILSRRWSIEATAGFGYMRYDYRRYGCAECSPLESSGKRNYFGPTKLGVNLIFVIK